MSDRFWVGGSGEWNGSDTTHWSASSGGVGGASVPTSSDNVFFDPNSGLEGGKAVTLADNNSSVCRDFISATNTSYMMGFTGYSTNVYGSLRLEPGLSPHPSEGAAFILRGTGSHTIDFNGNTNSVSYLNIYGTGNFTLLSDVHIVTDFYMEAGTLDLNDYNWRSNVFELYADETTPIPTVYLGNGVIDCKFFDIYSASLHKPVVYPELSTIRLSNISNLSDSPNFIIFDLDTDTGATGYIFNKVFILSAGTSGNRNLVCGVNYFKDFRIIGGNGIKFEQNVTQTFENFSARGASANIFTFTSCNPNTGTETTAAHTLLKFGGSVVDCDYLNLQHSIATPSATWFAGSHSTDNQTTATAGSGWIFTDVPNVDQLRDNNQVPVVLGVLNSDGATPTAIRCNPDSKAVKFSDGDSGSDAGPTNAARSANRVPTLMGVSSVDGTTPVPIYVDSSGNLLTKTT